MDPLGGREDLSQFMEIGWMATLDKARDVGTKAEQANRAQAGSDVGSDLCDRLDPRFLWSGGRQCDGFQHRGEMLLDLDTSHHNRAGCVITRLSAPFQFQQDRRLAGPRSPLDDTCVPRWCCPLFKPQGRFLENFGQDRRASDKDRKRGLFPCDDKTS